MKSVLNLVLLSTLIFAVKPAFGETQWVAKATSSSAHKAAYKRAAIEQTGAKDGIPHGTVAKETIGGKKIRAWYTKPTKRYAHGALGDSIEGGGLAMRIGSKRYDLELAKKHVFEDITPRIIDLNRDGIADIVTIRSSITRGAAIAIYTLKQGKIAELAATRPIGTANRWLNIAGIADFTGDGRPDIVSVVKPHIQGTLELHQFKSGILKRTASARGLSNHVYKSTELRLSAIADVNHDNVADIVLPGFGQQNLVAFSFRGGLNKVFDVRLASPLNSPIGVAGSKKSPEFIFRNRAGQLMSVSN